MGEIRSNTSRMMTSDEDFKKTFLDKSYLSNQFMPTQRQGNTKMLSNLPQGKFLEMKDMQMLPSA